MTTSQKSTDALSASFAPRLLTWFHQFGRHDLPWQYHHKPEADIYAVWLSEIMLQQTQVATVLGYFGRFLEKFPTVQALAAADWQDVATLWAGLGYYARARNLHAGAKQVADFIDKNGYFPQTLDEWQAVRGVGRSTAGAIVAMGVRDFGVICDGNVKRVLTRHRAIGDDITKSATDKALWELATLLTPQTDSGKYAQAMMDLGATICTRTRPKCDICPVASDCQARQLGRQTDFPVKKKAAAKPHRHSLVISLVHNDRTLWLHRHNGGGIWDGLWCLPMMALDYGGDGELSVENLQNLLEKAWRNSADDSTQSVAQSLAESQLMTVLNLPIITQPTKHIKHTLTHFHWHLYHLSIRIDDAVTAQIDDKLRAIHAEFVWCVGSQTLAKPTAMVKLLQG